MSRFRFLALFPFATLAVLSFSLLAAHGRQTPPPAKSAAPPQPAQPPTSKPVPTQPALPATSKPAPPAQPAPSKADPKAEKTIKQMMEQLDPTKLGWLETTLWQQVSSQDISFQAEGRYLSAPPDLLRLDMKIQLAGVGGESLLVSDGKTVWSSTRIGGGEPTATKFDLKKVEAVLNRPGTLPQAREEFYRAQAFLGLSPLLKGLNKQMVFTKQESARWKDRDVLKVTAEWSGDMAKIMTQQSTIWPPFVPRTCRLYLGRVEKHILWPYRIEWWGPTSIGSPDSLLLEMEFRDPKILKPGDKPAKLDAKTFAFPPGKKEPVDRTNAMVESAVQQTRSRQQPTQQGPGSRPPSGSPPP